MADTAVVEDGRLARLREWILLDGSRLTIAGVIVFVLFAALAVVPLFADGRLAQDALTRLFAALISGNLTLITVVIAINQLVLSRELRTPRELTEEIDAAVDYRDDVAATVDPRARPESPAAFLEHVLDRLEEAIERLDGAPIGVDDPEIQREADGIVQSLDEKVTTMRTLLAKRGVDLFAALTTILRYNLAPEYNGCRWLQRVHGPDLDEESVGALATVQQRIVDLEIARHYVKTIYVQVELAKVSRLLLYVGVVALSAAAIAMVVVGADPTPHPAFVRGAIALGFVPFAVLFAYIIRIATVAQRTSTFVPFGSTE